MSVGPSSCIIFKCLTPFFSTISDHDKQKLNPSARQKAKGRRHKTPSHPMPPSTYHSLITVPLWYPIQFKANSPIPLLLIFFCCFRTDTEKEKADHPHVYINEKTKRKKNRGGDTRSCITRNGPFLLGILWE